MTLIIHVTDGRFQVVDGDVTLYSGTDPQKAADAIQGATK